MHKPQEKKRLTSCSLYLTLQILTNPEEQYTYAYYSIHTSTLKL